MPKIRRFGIAFIQNCFEGSEMKLPIQSRGFVRTAGFFAPSGEGLSAAQCDLFCLGQCQGDPDCIARCCPSATICTP